MNPRLVWAFISLEAIVFDTSPTMLAPLVILLSLSAKSWNAEDVAVQKAQQYKSKFEGAGWMELVDG